MTAVSRGTDRDGRPLRGPNDIVFDAFGGFWFTDHGKSNGDTMQMGHLLYARPDGSLIRRVREGMITPNGVGLSRDGKTGYVAETHTSRVWALDIAGPGELAAARDMWLPGKVLGPLPGYRLLDSLAVEAGGKVCAATIVNGGITACDPDGGIEHFAFPDPITTSICFGGADMRDAWVTCSGTGKLYKARWPRPGLKLNFNAWGVAQTPSSGSSPDAMRSRNSRFNTLPEALRGRASTTTTCLGFL
jgi:gluconolactonase